MPTHPSDTQTSLRIPRGLRAQIEAQAHDYGRTFAAELRAAAEIALLLRTIWLLRHDAETCGRLGEGVAARRQRAEEALDQLCVKLFAHDVAVTELLSEHSSSGLRDDNEAESFTKKDHEAAVNGPVGKVGTDDAQSTA
jgi:hypothetical protein